MKTADGKIICPYCKREFEKKQKLAEHIIHCKLNPRYEELKLKVERNFDNYNNFNKHINEEIECYCQYCGKRCHSLNSLYNHERLCKENPNKKDSPFIEYNKDREPINQYIKAKKLGLPKPEMSEEGKKHCGDVWRGKHLTKKMKEKISKSRKQYLEEHPDKVPFILNHASKKSYPEQYFEELFLNENIDLKYHKQVGRYQLDFYNESLMKYIEIDGEQHYLPYMIKHDKERTEYLLNLGWKGIRIRWTEYQKLSFEDKQNKINEIREFLK